MHDAQPPKKPGRFKSALQSRGRQLERWMLDGSEAVGTHQSDDLKADAQWAAGQQQARGSRLLIWAALLAVLALLVWAAFGRIDEVVRGQGKVVPSRQVQVVQSLDG
ncbi:MAG: HlyD family type I secretion periplasmic adaptor subunit, partial [Comamonas sp.]